MSCQTHSTPTPARTITWHELSDTPKIVVFVLWYCVAVSYSLLWTKLIRTSMKHKKQSWHCLETQKTILRSPWNTKSWDHWKHNLEMTDQNLEITENTIWRILISLKTQSGDDRSKSRDHWKHNLENLEITENTIWNKKKWCPVHLFLVLETEVLVWVINRYWYKHRLIQVHTCTNTHKHTDAQTHTHVFYEIQVGGQQSGTVSWVLHD